MKKVLSLIAISGAVTAFGQGVLQLDTQIGAAPIAIYQPGGTTLVDNTFKGQVWYNGAKLGPETTFSAKGRFNGGPAEVPGVAAGVIAKGISLQVLAKDGVSLATESAKFDTGGLGGVDASGTPVPNPKLVNLQSFTLTAAGPGGPTTVIPEPSTIALGLLGAAALFFRSRK